MHPVKTNPVATTAINSATSEGDGKRPFVLAHFSDPHLSTLAGVITLRHLLNKRLLGFLSWYRRRRHIHSPRILDALLADLADTAPDHIVVTGDLTNWGCPMNLTRLPAGWRRSVRRKR